VWVREEVAGWAKSVDWKGRIMRPARGRRVGEMYGEKVTENGRMARKEWEKESETEMEWEGRKEDSLLFDP